MRDSPLVPLCSIACLLCSFISFKSLCLSCGPHGILICYSFWFLSYLSVRLLCSLSLAYSLPLSFICFPVSLFPFLVAALRAFSVCIFHSFVFFLLPRHFPIARCCIEASCCCSIPAALFLRWCTKASLYLPRCKSPDGN